MLSHLPGFSVTWSQNRQPLGAGGNPAGSVEDQTEEKEENGHKSVASYGHQCSCGQAWQTLLRFHDVNASLTSWDDEIKTVPWFTDSMSSEMV